MTRVGLQPLRQTVPPTGGKALAGFLLSGFLLALLGAILPAWGYHRDPPDFVAVGNYFLSLAVGIVSRPRSARRIMARRGVCLPAGLRLRALLRLAGLSGAGFAARVRHGGASAGCWPSGSARDC